MPAEIIKQTFPISTTTAGGLGDDTDWFQIADASVEVPGGYELLSVARPTLTAGEVPGSLADFSYSETGDPPVGNVALRWVFPTATDAGTDASGVPGGEDCTGTVTLFFIARDWRLGTYDTTGE